MIAMQHHLDQLVSQQLRKLARSLMATLGLKDEALQGKERDIQFKTTRIAQLSHEIAMLRRHKFGQKSEQFTGVQANLFEEAIGEKMTQASMPAHIIDKGPPATGLLTQILINKLADHLPLYR